MDTAQLLIQERGYNAFHPIGRIGQPEDVDDGVMAGRN